jgi:hypothetical protein
MTAAERMGIRPVLFSRGPLVSCRHAGQIGFRDGDEADFIAQASGFNGLLSY